MGSPAVAARPPAGARRSTRACSGIVSTACTAASTSKAPRQPSRSVSRPASGRKMLLAKPATTVMASSALRMRSAGNSPTVTANAGSYSDIAEAAPMPTCTRYS